MKVCAGHEAAFAWIRSRTGCALTPDARAIQALDASGRIRGVVAYDLWTEFSCHAHMAVDNPMVWRPLLGPAFEYPFVEAKRGIIYGVIVETNEKSLRMTRHLGFREMHHLKDGWTRGIDLVVFEMRRENCRFLRANRKAA